MSKAEQTSGEQGGVSVVGCFFVLLIFNCLYNMLFHPLHWVTIACVGILFVSCLGCTLYNTIRYGWTGLPQPGLSEGPVIGPVMNPPGSRIPSEHFWYLSTAVILIYGFSFFILAGWTILGVAMDYLQKMVG